MRCSRYLIWGTEWKSYCKEETAASVIETANKFNIGAKIIGRTEKAESPENKVIIKYKGGTYEY